MQNGATTTENSVKIQFKKLKIQLPHDPTITPLLGIYPQALKSEQSICTLIFIVAQLIIAEMWKQLKCSLTAEWIKKMCYIHTILPRLKKKKEILLYVTKEMNFEDITLYEISQPQKNKYYMIAPI